MKQRKKWLAASTKIAALAEYQSKSPSLRAVARKCYYDYLKRKAMGNEELELIVEFIRTVQTSTNYAVGYRHMTNRIKTGLSLVINKKRVLSIMSRYNLLSVVRRKRFTPEQYLRRRELRAEVPEDLLKRRFFSLEPRKIFVCDITYLLCLEQVLYLNSIVDLFNREVAAWKISQRCDEQLVISTVTGRPSNRLI
ncbi:MAG: IS3 family transposase [Spirochaetales bacterium]|nr:IS3 family transposase [Spirochaetales bacterium]